jgi:hypothetical protein
MPFYKVDVNEEGEAVEAAEYYERAQTQVSLVSADDWVKEMHQRLLDLGYRSITVRYDGGYDEGFAYFDRAERQFGGTVEATTVAVQLLSGTLARHAETRQTKDGGLQLGNMYLSEPGTANQRMGYLMDEFAHHGASALLGDGYGTGEYTMRGWFR